MGPILSTDRLQVTFLPGVGASAGPPPQVWFLGAHSWPLVEHVATIDVVRHDEVVRHDPGEVGAPNKVGGLSVSRGVKRKLNEGR